MSAFLDSYQYDDSSWKLEYGNQEEIGKRILAKIQQNLPKEKKKTKKKGAYIQFLKYAASVLLLMGIGFYWHSQQDNTLDVDSIDKDQIVLKLSDGTTKIINSNEKKQIVNKQNNLVGMQLQGKISYASTVTNNTASTIEYNELYVPYGKKFEVELSDGTRVALNAGSSLRYPVSFLKEQPREVFLKGEAYFDVAKSKTTIFKVYTNKIVTEVYGTQFNIMAYENEVVQEVVLVEGSVGVSKKKETLQSKLLLEPNQKAQLNTNTSEMRKEEVDVESYIAWNKRVLNFRNLKFENILRKMERHFNLKIKNNYTELEEIPFTGTFETETPAQILRYLSHIRAFDYVVDGDVITINKAKE